MRRAFTEGGEEGGYNEVQRSQQSTTRSHTSSRGRQSPCGWVASSARRASRTPTRPERRVRHSENRKSSAHLEKESREGQG